MVLDIITTTGYIAGVIQTGRTIPQIISSIRMKSTRDLSSWTIIMSLSGALLWLSYGVMVGSAPIVVTDSISSFLLSVLFVIKKIHG